MQKQNERSNFKPRLLKFRIFQSMIDIFETEIESYFRSLSSAHILHMIPIAHDRKYFTYIARYILLVRVVSSFKTLLNNRHISISLHIVFRV